MAIAYERALEIMTVTPAVLRAIVGNLPEDALRRRPAAEEWSPYEILVHMARGEAAMIGTRVRGMLAHDDAELATPEPVTLPEEPAALLDVWEAARKANLALFHGLTDDQLARTGRHARFGRISAREHIIEWAYHDLDHQRQMLTALQAELYPDIGAFHSLYPQPV